MALPVEEPESLVVFDRAGDNGAELVAAQGVLRQRGRAEIVARIELVVAKVFIEIAVQRIGAGT